jgi:hypothetical protein
MKAKIAIIIGLVVSVGVSAVFFNLAKNLITGRTVLADALTDIYFEKSNTWIVGLSLTLIAIGLALYPFVRDVIKYIKRRRQVSEEQ